MEYWILTVVKVPLSIWKLIWAELVRKIRNWFAWIVLILWLLLQEFRCWLKVNSCIVLYIMNVCLWRDFNIFFVFFSIYYIFFTHIWKLSLIKRRFNKSRSLRLIWIQSGRRSLYRMGRFRYVYIIFFLNNRVFFKLLICFFKPINSLQWWFHIRRIFFTFFFWIWFYLTLVPIVINDFHYVIISLHICLIVLSETLLKIRLR